MGYYGRSINVIGQYARSTEYYGRSINVNRHYARNMIYYARKTKDRTTTMPAAQTSSTQYL